MKRDAFLCLLCILFTGICHGQQEDFEYNPDVDNDGWIGVSDLTGLLAKYDSPWPPLVDFNDCGDAIEYNGYVYSTVEINGRCWFAENLQTDRYRNGDPLLFSTDYGHPWTSTTEGYQTYYQNDSVEYADLGRLYNWYAVNDTRGLCPSGWIVPDMNEWKNIGPTPQSAGGDLKSSQYWNPPNTGFSDVGLLNAFPSGRKRSSWWSGFSGHGLEAVFWTPNFYDDDHAFAYRLTYYSPELDLTAIDKNAGMSVRCVLNEDFTGCTSEEYLEYNAVANVDDGSCLTLKIEGCMNELAQNYNEVANVDDGSCEILDSPCNGYQTITFDSFEYSLVEIGSQCWFKENLRSESNNTGLSLPFTTDFGAWTQWSSSGYSVMPDLTASQDYGFLYNWYSAGSGEVCPSGWRVPQKSDFDLLLETAGGAENAGGALKATSNLWLQPNIGATDAYGFSALPAGKIRDCWWCGGTELGSKAHFWTSTADTVSAVEFSLSHDSISIQEDNSSFNLGLSVRCIRD